MEKLGVMILKQFDLVIYPSKLWVYVGSNLEGIGRKFNYLKSDLPFYEYNWESNCDAFVNSVIDVDTRKAGIFVGFRDGGNDSLIAHEALHVVQRVFKYVGEKKPGRECSAYLLEYVINCINETMIEYGKDCEGSQAV